jgi:subtilisin family serine protease
MPSQQLLSQHILVARIDEQRGEALRQNAPPHVIIEPDAPLGYSDMMLPEPMFWRQAVLAIPFPRPRRELRFRVLGAGDRPLANAVVNLYGPGFPTQTVTDASGNASLQSYAVDDAGIHAIYVRPAADHWERYIQNPPLETGQVNVIRLSPLERRAGSFPGERSYGWGQRLMKFDRVPAEWNGAGTKIGIIDSGCDHSHPQLHHIVRGVDLTRDKDLEGWKLDELGQGTHCAGIVAASAAASSSIMGSAPASEVHIFKVVPGGHFSDLIEALGLCIERQLDIVQIGVSGEQFSELVAQRIAEASWNGIACIAGSGNSGTAVQFPGNVPGVIAVSAIGKLGEYPHDTRHAQRALPQQFSYSGVYATNFSCWGPQVAVCAPGVAVVSSVPGGGYAAWDGGAMAASHVTGFSSLLLAHHPMLQSIHYGARADQRVAVLFDLLRAAAIPYALVDPQRVGAGLPDLQQAAGWLAAGPIYFGAGIGSAPTTVGAAPSPYAASSPYAAPSPYTAPSPYQQPGPYPGNPMSAILQWRAAGLWV